MRGLVLCIRRRLRADVIVTEIENKQFRVLIQSFLCVFTENVRATTSVMLSEQGILDEEVLTIFNEMEVQNSPLKISFS